MTENVTQSVPLATCVELPPTDALNEITWSSRRATHAESPSAVETKERYSTPGVVDQKLCSAIHEAAHAVVAVWFGGRVQHIEIESIGDGRGDRVTMSYYARLYSEGAIVCVSCAGWQAEAMALGATDAATELPQSDDDLEALIEAIRERYQDPDFWAECIDIDAGQALASILSHRLDATNQEAIAVYRAYQAATEAILKRTDIWAAIRALAGKLLEAGTLTGQQVEECIGRVSSVIVGGHWLEGRIRPLIHTPPGRRVAG